MAEFEHLLAIRRAAIQLDEEDELMALMAADDEPEPEDEEGTAGGDRPQTSSQTAEVTHAAAPSGSALSPEHHAKLDALLAKLETKG